MPHAVTLKSFTVIVVGAGIAGLACARELQAGGLSVCVLEKSAGVGGRCATRRTEAGAFDHGAQYFTARDPRFQTLVHDLRGQGVVADIDAGIVRLVQPGEYQALPVEPRYAAVPGMNALGKTLAQGLDIRPGHRVLACERAGQGWRLRVETPASTDQFDAAALVLALPSDQAVALAADSAMGAELAARPMTPCWAVMAAFDAPVDFSHAGVLIEAPVDPALSWIMRDSAKPGRGPGERWVLHARDSWSQAHLDADRATVRQRLIERFRALTGAPMPSFAVVHRWRFAAGGRAAAEGCLVDPALRLAACGDWAQQGRIEGAWLSGLAAGQRVHGLLQ